MAPARYLGDLLILLGLLSVLVGAVLWRCPGASRHMLQAFPRAKWAGWALTAVDVFWVTWVVRHAALGWFEPFKPLVPVLGVVVFMLIVWLLDELLAPRALGGLLLLLANPMLNSVRWHDSAWRLVVVTIAYAWVVAGALLVLYPWFFRRWAAKPLAHPQGLRVLAVAKLVAGVVLLIAGVAHLR